MFGFPQNKRENNFQLKTNLLKSFTLQLNFEKVDFLSKKDEIKYLLNGKFKSDSNLATNSFEIKSVNNSPVIVQKPTEVTGIVFESVNPKKTFQIMEDSITLTYDGLTYLNIESFIKDIGAELIQTLNILKVNNISRIGIRKINLVPYHQNSSSNDVIEKMAEIFTSELINSYSQLPFVKFMEASINNISASDGKEKLVLNYGVLPSDGKVRNVLLDIDVISLGGSNITELQNEIMRINQEIFSIFTWAIAPKFFGKLI